MDNENVLKVKTLYENGVIDNEAIAKELNITTTLVTACLDLIKKSKKQSAIISTIHNHTINKDKHSQNVPTRLKPKILASDQLTYTFSDGSITIDSIKEITNDTLILNKTELGYFIDELKEIQIFFYERVENNYDEPLLYER